MRPNEEVARPGGSGAGGPNQLERSRAELFAKALVASYVDGPRFVPRPWLLGRVEEALDRPRARFVLLTGEPGSGKSALMAHLARLHQEWPRHFLRRDSVTTLQGGDARMLLFSVGYQLAHLHPSLFDPRRLEVVVNLRAGRIASGGRVAGIEASDLQASPFYQESLHVTAQANEVAGELVGISAGRMTLEPRLLELSNLQYLALLDPAQALAKQDSEAQIVILVDALDEVRYGARGEDVLSWLAASPELPSNIRFVLTSRPDPDLLGAFRQAKSSELVELSIDPEGEEDRDRIREDLRRFLDRVAAGPAVARAFEANKVQPASFIKDAADKAKGNFQYAVALARGIDQALTTKPPSKDLPTLLRLEGIPSGTSQLYRFFLTKIKEEADRTPVKVSTDPLAEPEDRSAWDALYYPILAVLAVAFQRLGPEQLQAYTAVPPEGLPRALEDLAQFLDRNPDGRYRLYHATFPEFLTGEATASPADPFHVDPSVWHGRVAGRLLRANPDWLVCEDRYPLAYAPAHLLEAASGLSDPDDQKRVFRSLSGLVSDFGFLEQKTAVLGVDVVVADLHAADEVLPATESTVAVLRHIFDREAHNLRDWERESLPALLAQQIHNRALSEGQTYLGEVTARRLASLGKPYLAVQWRIGEVSPSLVRTLTGHVSGVLTVAVTPDGSRAVSGSRGGTLIVWDLQSGQKVRAIASHQAKIRAVAITADGRRALSTSEDRSFKLWDLETGKLIKTLSDDEYFAIAITPDGRRAVCGAGSGNLRVWDLDTGRVVKTLIGHQIVASAVVITADERRVVSGSIDGTLKVWDLESGRMVRTLTGHKRGVMAVAVTADGRRALSASEDRSVRVWDVESGRAVRTLTGHRREVMAVAVTADGRRALSGSWDQTVRVWDVKSGRAVRTLIGHETEVWAVAMTADGSYGLSGSADGILKVWDLDSKEDSRNLTGQREAISSVAITRDGRRALLGSDDGSILLRDVKSGTPVGTLLGREPRVWAIASHGHLAISGSADNALGLWDLRAGREIRTFTGHKDTIYSVAITADGRQAVSGSTDGAVRVWDLQKGESRSLLGHEEAVLAVAISSNGHRAISGSMDGTLEVWDLKGLENATTLSGHKYPISAVGISSDGHRAISGSVDGTLKVWNFKAGTEVRRLTGHVIWTVAMSPDGRRAISGSTDGTLKLLDLQARKKTATLIGHEDAVQAVAMTANGEMATSASQDGTLRMWDLQRGQEVGILIRTVPRREPQLSAIAVSPDDRRAISGSEDGTLKVWDLQTGQELRALPGCAPEASMVAVTSDGRRAISAKDYGSLDIWDLETGTSRTLADDDSWAWAVTSDTRWAVSGGTLLEQVIKVWDLESGKARNLGTRGSLARAVAVTPDCRTVMAGLLEGTLKVWSLKGHKKVLTITGHKDEIHGLAIASDGSRAVSGSYDRTIRVWDLKRREALCMMALDAGITNLATSADANIILVRDTLQNLWCVRLSTGT